MNDGFLAYVLISVKPTEEHTVYTSLCKNSVIDEVAPLFGEWDLIAKITAEDKKKLSAKIIENISSIDGILATKTLMGY